MAVDRSISEETTDEAEVDQAIVDGNSDVKANSAAEDTEDDDLDDLDDMDFVLDEIENRIAPLA